MSAFWNYRVIECPAEDKTDLLYQIHEVEYNIKGQAVNWSETSVAPYGATVEALQADYQRQQSAFERPVLKVVRKPRGYELVNIDDGKDAYADPPASLNS